MKRALAIAVLTALWASCSFDRMDHPQACEDDAECEPGSSCFDHFCVVDGPVGASCAEGNAIATCYEGPEGTLDVGACAAGQRLCAEGLSTACIGQVTPAGELCNGKDDDCDGEVDEEVGGSSCNTRLKGACGEGELICRDGVELCQPARDSQMEVCNAVDDDCDGLVDEAGQSPCYGADTGCARDADGIFICEGLCATGTMGCVDGQETCAGTITPIEEDCASDGVAQDEDCDGLIDEACPCTDGEERPCYAGPIGTEGHGRCQSGTQTCSAGQWGHACEGQVVPKAETCKNSGADDDCNDVMDDIPGLDSPCVATDALGECRNGTFACAGAPEPECVGGEPSSELCDELDQDCDGDPTNGFDFESEAACGACDNVCQSGQYCCQGRCLPGAGPMEMACECRSDCGDKACCGKDCRDLRTDEKNCGACGKTCKNDETCFFGVCR